MCLLSENFNPLRFFRKRNCKQSRSRCQRCRLFIASVGRLESMSCELMQNIKLNEMVLQSSANCSTVYLFLSLNSTRLHLQSELSSTFKHFQSVGINDFLANLLVVSVECDLCMLSFNSIPS